MLIVRVHPANIQDRDGAREVLTPLSERHWRLKKIWADGGYRGELVAWLEQLRLGRGRHRIHLQIVEKTCAGGFAVLPKRWIGERTFAWLGRSRRLSKDYEALCETTETLIYLAMIQLMTRRLARRKP